MRIVDLKVFVHINDLRGKVWNPKIRWTRKHAVLVELTTSEGLTGLGECWCFDTEPDALIAFLASEVVPRVVELEFLLPSDLSGVLTDTTTLSARHGIMASAMSGIDIALWDIAAKANGMPLYRQLGGSSNRVRVYASGGLYGEGKTAADLVEELAGYVKAGFDTVKLKVGGLAPAADAERVRAVRRGLGEGPRLIVDGVYSFDTESAAAFYRSIADCGIEAFQAPLPADDIAGMNRLVQVHGVPVMGIEAEYRAPIVELLIERRAVDILQIALVACGGIDAARGHLCRAATKAIPVSLEVSSTAVAQMAAFHFGAAHPQVASVEYHMVHRALFDLLPFAPSDIDGGFLVLPETPGLGITLPKERVERRL